MRQFNRLLTGARLTGLASAILLTGCNTEFGSVTSSESVETTGSVSQTSYAYPIVDTNQTLCYSSATGATIPCTGKGYDADYQGYQPSYTTSSDGQTVLDNVTGLRWTQSTDINGSGTVDYNDKLFQADAVRYCQNLTLGGYRWRLPSVKEAYSLMLFSGKDASTYLGTDTSTLTPFIDPHFDRAFGDRTTLEGQAAGERLIDAQYASSTLYVSTTMNGDATMFGVNYIDGRIKGYPTALKKYYVRCVTGNPLYGENSFFDNGDGTISDQATGLMWEQDDHVSADWENAVQVCETASTAGHSDWRLPNVKVLQSLVDYSRSPDTDGDAAIDVLFHSTALINEKGVQDWGYYWASTTHVDNNNDGTNATYVAFGRALGYMMLALQDVHGAGAQRSNDKQDITREAGVAFANLGAGLFYFHGPQGDILRLKNKVRCVRNL